MRSKGIKLLSSLIVMSPIGALFLPGCSNSGIVVANFESYMSQDLMDQTKKEYGCQFLYYDTNETIETKFERNYDIAIPSSYEAMILKKKNQLEKIDWTKFGMKVKDNNGQVVDVTRDTAKFLFTDTVQEVISAQDQLYGPTSAGGLGYLDAGESILDYGIPYFLQSWMFAYTGEEISNLTNATTWKEVANEIRTNDWFKPGRAANIACVDDSRTFYGMSKLVYDQENGVEESKQNINPSNDGQSIEQYEKEYNSFVKGFKSGSFYFNSDSQQILLSLADTKGVHGALCYNGDALYALMGGGIVGWEEQWTDENFHAVMPENTVITLDMLVFNKKNENNETKRDKVYEIAHKLVLEGAGADDGDIAELDEDEENFVCGPMINFDFVMYTSPLKEAEPYIIKRDGGYMDFAELLEEQKDRFLQMYEIKLPTDPSVAKNLFEKPLSDLDKSNMHWAYEPEKEKL